MTAFQAKNLVCTALPRKSVPTHMTEADINTYAAGSHYATPGFMSS